MQWKFDKTGRDWYLRVASGTRGTVRRVDRSGDDLADIQRLAEQVGDEAERLTREAELLELLAYMVSQSKAPYRPSDALPSPCNKSESDLPCPGHSSREEPA